LRDNLTVIDWYLKSSREDIVNRLLATDELEHSVRFAMDTWGIMFQSMVPGMTTSFLLAKEMGNLLRSMMVDQQLAVVRQVACRAANDRGLFNLYVKFDWAPDPHVAIKYLSLACLELNGL